MIAALTRGISISVEVSYAPGHSDPVQHRYVFSYRITIANQSDRTVQLRRRHWHIWDSLAPAREVEGPGVVGETPVLAPGETYTYSSYCDLRSGVGRMAGSYAMLDLAKGEIFKAKVPDFVLCYPYLAN
jgi:ApaG protein